MSDGAIEVGLLVVAAGAFVAGCNIGVSIERSGWCHQELALATTAADSLALYRNPLHRCPIEPPSQRMPN